MSFLTNVNKKAVDLFCGAGGFSTGATMAGLDVVWACDFDAEALSWHRANHPGCGHALRDLAPLGREPSPDLFDDVPDFDVLLASPCCQGHSKGLGGAARGHHAPSRATAWAPVVLAEARRPETIIVENVPEFRLWDEFPAWSRRIIQAGYNLSEMVVDASTVGVPQARKRLFVVATRIGTGSAPMAILPKHVSSGPSARAIVRWVDILPHYACA